MQRTKKIAIFLIIAGITVIAIIWGLHRAGILHLPVGGSSDVVFRLIDGETGQPMINTKITVCDNAIVFDRVAGEGGISKGICSEQKIWERVTTDQEGKFSFNVKSMNITPPTDIIIELSDDYRYSAVISRSDTLTNHYSPSHLRVLNAEAPYHLVSNLLYNLDTKEVREIFLNGSPEQTRAFEVIDLKVFIVK